MRLYIKGYRISISETRLQIYSLHKKKVIFYLDAVVMTAFIKNLKILLICAGAAEIFQLVEQIIKHFLP